MKKIRLEMDELRVESFETARAERRTGTVHGAAYSEWQTCNEFGDTCNGGNSCWDSCGCVSYPDYCGGDSGLNLSCIESCLVTCEPC